MEGLEVYKTILEELPGISSYQLLKPASGAEHRGDARLRLRTEAGAREFVVEVYRSHLTHKMADLIVNAGAGSEEPRVILAPHIGVGLAEKLSGAGVNYVDANGNCHIEAPPLYVHIEGKSAGAKARADKGLRRAGYQVLFVYLAETSLLDAPIRRVAELAGVSRQPVADMRHRLLDEQYVLSTKSALRWHPRRRQDGLSLWLHGYETTVRPSLLWGTYRTQDKDPAELEERLERGLAGLTNYELRWGGSAAGFRLTGHYRGARTVAHVRSPPNDLQRRLPAMEDPSGNLVLMDAFGTLNWQPERRTVHPLLVYSEILREGTERAREAAQELYEEHLLPTWEQVD